MLMLLMSGGSQGIFMLLKLFYNYILGTLSSLGRVPVLTAVSLVSMLSGLRWVIMSSVHLKMMTANFY